MTLKINFLYVRILTVIFLIAIFMTFHFSESFGQPGVYPKEALVKYTPLNPYDRFPDGRPRVPDDILKRMKEVTVVEAWSVLRRHGYHHQYEEGNWKILHPERKLVGRAVTCVFMPIRPALNEVIAKQGIIDKRKGRGQNSWVIDTLVLDDVIVVDLFGKIKDGTFAGDNLATSIHSKTGTGMVIDGSVRDLEGILPIPNFTTFIRGVSPTGIADVMLMGINVPIRIGNVTVMPGDLVLGSEEGLIFIPPHLAQEVVESSERTRLRDEFGHQRLREGKYTPGQIDQKWTPEIQKDFEEWLKERNKKQR